MNKQARYRVATLKVLMPIIQGAATLEAERFIRAARDAVAALTVDQAKGIIKHCPILTEDELNKKENQ